MLLGRIELALLEQEVPKVVFHSTRRAQVRFDRVEGDGLVEVLPGGGRLLLATVGESQTVMHLGQLEKVLDAGGRGYGCVVVANRGHIGMRSHVHAGYVTEDPGFDLVRFRGQLPATLERLVGERKGLRIIQKSERARLPVQCLDRHPLVADSLKLYPSEPHVLQSLSRSNQPAVGLADAEMNDGLVPSVPVLLQQGGAQIDHALQLSNRGEPLQLAKLRLAFGQGRWSVRGQEELDRFSRQAGDLLQGLDRGPCASLLDQVDRRACERAAGHLGQGQLGLPARLLDRALADGNAAAAATVFGAEHGDEFTARPGSRLLN